VFSSIENGGEKVQNHVCFWQIGADMLICIEEELPPSIKQDDSCSNESPGILNFKTNDANPSCGPV
jgi:hypothetical protein